ncbi:MAG TPA: polysaccharide deacetylase family protein [Solirubrobacterales bacterium]
MALGEAIRPGRADFIPSVDLVILCYHAVSPSWESFLAVEPDRLRAQARHLLRRGYRPKTLSQALSEPLDERTFVVTFDDGYRSNLELGLPVLQALGVPATVFVPTDLIDEAGLFECLPEEHMPVDEEELRCMSWDEVRSLADAGWEIGSHTCTHPHLTQVDDRQLAFELRRSREVCEERLQRRCESIAYPFGSHDERVMSATGEAGYRYAVTLETRLFQPIDGRGPLDLPREGIFRETRLPKYLLNTSRLVRRVRLSRWYGRLAFGRLAVPAP